MLNAVIRFSLNNRMAIIAVALGVMVMGSITATELPIDVLPDLTRPRVSILTEAPGLAPEEVETLITVPIETAVNGANGVQTVRSSSDIGLSVITVDFDWDADIYTARQIVQERVSTVREQLPDGVEPQLGPISSLLGQVIQIGMWSEGGATPDMDLRTSADWDVRKRLQAIPGVSSVLVLGGGRKQFQVLVDVHDLHEHEVTLHDVEEALAASNLNVTGGYLDKQSRRLLIRGLGRIESLDDIRKVVIRGTGNRPVLVEHVADVVEAEAVKTGDGSINGKPGIVLTVQKQPGIDTRLLTEQVETALVELRASMADDVRMEMVYKQREFIDHSVNNVLEALRDGSILVVIVLFLFLLNLRTTLITLTAIPLSIVVTALIFKWFGLSINVMTLGGLAVALGELVDDAIVDVENIFIRLRENRALDQPRSSLRVIYEASQEVRGAIIISTVMVILVFAPLFALSGIEGRLFTPLGVAYIVSICASTLVSLTVTPVLSYLLLSGTGKNGKQIDGIFLRLLKAIASPVVRFSMTLPGFLLLAGSSILAITLSVLIMLTIGRNFLPPFDEGAVQVNLYLPPGASLETSKEVRAMADRKLAKLTRSDKNPDAPLLWYVGKTGRAEEDEHVMGVNVTEFVISLNPDVETSTEELFGLLDETLSDLPGVTAEIEQPIGHLISHMLSGVTAQIAIKIYGDNLETLRSKAVEVQASIADVRGIAPPVIEQQQLIPQLRIKINRDALAEYGLTPQEVNEQLETALNGRVVTSVLDRQRSFDVLVRFDKEERDNDVDFERIPFELPGGSVVPLSELASIQEARGPNTVKREDGRRRIVVRVNTRGRDLESAVTEIQRRIRSDVELPEGYFISYGGQFEAQRSATKIILWLSLLSLFGVGLILYGVFRSVWLVLQILIAIPAAFVGGVTGILITGQTFSVASLVGFISLGGIAARNGILLIGTWQQRFPEEGFTKEMILHGSLDRLAPVLMTALTTGLGLVPLVLGGHLPGKEILFPVATVILGGLVTSTLAEFLLRPGLFWFLSERTIRKLHANEATRPEVLTD